MENSKRIKRIIKHLDELEEVMDYFMAGNKHYTPYFDEIRELIDELGLNMKEHNARFAKKLKAIYESQE